MACALLVAPATSGGKPTLEDLLANLDRVAALYQDNALRFTCHETITNHSNSGRTVDRFHYIYRYDDEVGLSDYRLPRSRRERRKKSLASRVQAVDLGSYGLPAVLLRGYSWIFIFEASKRDAYRYEIIGNDVALGRPAVRVGFEPVPPHVENINEWSGTAWVDLDSFQLLRVEAYERTSHANLLRLERDRADSKNKSFRTYAIERFVTEFAIEQNGMRFPSRVEIRKMTHSFPGHGKGTREHLIRQSYDHYRFFGVRTADQISKIVLGD